MGVPASADLRGEPRSQKRDLGHPPFLNPAPDFPQAQSAATQLQVKQVVGPKHQAQRNQRDYDFSHRSDDERPCPLLT